MKRLLLTSIFMLIASCFVFSTSVSANELSKKEITQRFLEIDSKYDIGEEFNAEDTEFVKMYAKKTGNNSSKSSEKSSDLNISPLASKTFYGTGKAPNSNHKAAVLGTYTLKQGYFNQSYTLSMTTAMSAGKADKIVNEYTHTAYGTFGSGGLAKVYSKNDKRSTTSSQSLYSLFTENYTAHVLYYSQFVKSTIYHNGNRSFDITVNPI